MDHDGIITLGVPAAKNRQITRIEVVRRPLTFNGQRRPAARPPDEINLVVLLVPSIANSMTLGGSVQLVEHEMFSEIPQVFITQRCPAPMVTDEGIFTGL
jgi:hypothetical protein